MLICQIITIHNVCHECCKRNTFPILNHADYCIHNVEDWKLIGSVLHELYIVFYWLTMLCIHASVSLFYLKKTWYHFLMESFHVLDHVLTKMICFYNSECSFTIELATLAQ